MTKIALWQRYRWANVPLMASLLLIPTLPAMAVPGALDRDTVAKMDRFLVAQARTANSRTRGWTNVIVAFAGEGPSALQREREAAVMRLMGDPYRHLPLLGATAFRIPTRNLLAVAALPFVVHLSADTLVHKNDEFTVDGSGAGVAFDDYGLTGKGVGVAVLDTGIADDHPDFSQEDENGCHDNDSRVTAAANFAPGRNTTEDDCGHGTHVAGIIGGNGQASTGRQYYRTFYGIARRASLVSVRVLDNQGQGNVSGVIAGINWAITNKNRYNIRVMNVSLGHEIGESYQTDPLCRALKVAWQSGIVVVCAAGNGGRARPTPVPGLDNGGYGTAYGTIQSPANSPYVITVGSTSRLSPSGARFQDQVSTYSSHGPSRLDFVLKPDIVAPGNAVISTIGSGDNYVEQQYEQTNAVLNSEYKTHGNRKASRSYFRLSGTSMAAPVVAGAAALLLEKEPRLTPDTVKLRLMLSADKWGLPNGRQDPCLYGAGYIDIPATLLCTATPRVPVLSPTLSRSGDGMVWFASPILYNIGGVTSPYGSGVPGGLQAIWGGNAVSDTGRLASSPTVAPAPVWSDSLVFTVSGMSIDLSSVVVGGDR